MSNSTEPTFLALPDGRRIRQVRLFIHQPKLHSEPQECVVSIKDLLAFARRARSGAASCENAARHYGRIKMVEWNKTYLNQNPNEVDCAFCRAMSTCPSAQAKVRASITPLGAIEDIDEVPTGDTPEIKRRRRYITAPFVPVDLDALNAAMKAAPFIEDWILAVRAEIERRLLAGETFADFGLELGRKGNKAFSDPEVATALLRKKFRLKEKDVFKFTLKTPTQLADLAEPSVDPETGEKLPALLGPKQWEQVQELITQADPKPSVKPKSKIRTPYVPVVTPMDAVPDEDDEPTLY